MRDLELYIIADNMVTEMNNERTLNTIQRIAETLGVSEDEFLYEKNDGAIKSLTGNTLSESLELLKAFTEIKDREVRMNCLELLKNSALASKKLFG